MASDKYDAFPQAIIILLLDLFLVCRWQQPQRCMPQLHSKGVRGRRRGKGAAETRGHRLERYKRVRGSRETRTRRGELPTAASPLLLRLLLTSFLSSFFSHLSAFLRGPSTTGYRCHYRDTDYKLHSICNEVHLFWRPTLVAPGPR